MPALLNCLAMAPTSLYIRNDGDDVSDKTIQTINIVAVSIFSLFSLGYAYLLVLAFLKALRDHRNSVTYEDDTIEMA